MTNDKRIMAEAAAWADRASHPDADLDDAAAFESWMNASPAHRAAFAEMIALWRSDALTQAAAEVEQRADLRRPLRVPWRLAAPSALAMAAVCIAAVLVAPWMDHRTLETRRGETRTVALADGTSIRLNGDARLSIRQSPLWRAATLERGEAWFEVRHDGRPFVVDAGEGEVRVMGTAFNVDRMACGRAEVTLYRGAVRLRTRGGQVLDLEPGDRAMLEHGRIRPTTHSLSTRPDWTDGWFDAEETTLGRLVAEIDRFSRTPVVIDGQASRIPVSGRFRLTDPPATLALIERAYDVRIDTTGETIVVRSGSRQPDRR
jgi:transmembrane sensor